MFFLFDFFFLGFLFLDLLWLLGRLGRLDRARREGIVGVHGDALKIALRAPPADGAANSALLKLLSTAFGVARNKLEIVTGKTSRLKRVCFQDVPQTELQRLVEGLENRT